MKYTKLIAVILSTSLLFGCGGGGGGGGSKSSPTPTKDPIEVSTPAFADADGDGMVDEYETKYGFDPNDAGSYPFWPNEKVQEYVGASTNYPTAEVNFSVRNTEFGVTVSWADQGENNLSLNVTEGSTEVINGGHQDTQWDVDFSNYGFDGDEVLTIDYSLSRKSDGEFVSDNAGFTLDLNDHVYQRPELGAAENRISFTFKDFDAETEALYSNFLNRLYPIFVEVAGAPAESFNMVIEHMGTNANYFMIVDQGRTMLTDGRFIPRLITHELLHAWKGQYLIASDDNWQYQTNLNGFEESLAQGFAFEIMQEFMKAYPDAEATKTISSNPRGQGYSEFSAYYDRIKTKASTGAGEFWTGTIGLSNQRYGIAATTVQIINVEYPNFYKDVQQAMYAEINADPEWRTDRENVMQIWETIAPTVQGVALRDFLDAMPVFKGGDLEDRVYLQTTLDTEVQFTADYVLNGREWWYLHSDDLNTVVIPEQINYELDANGWVIPDVQGNDYNLSISSGGNVVKTLSGKTGASYDANGVPTGTGMHLNDDANPSKFTKGLYTANVNFTDLAGLEGAEDSYMFFGRKSLQLNDPTIMVGVDTSVTVSNIEMEIGSSSYNGNATRGAAYVTVSEDDFMSKSLVNLTVNTDSGSCSYQRTLVGALDRVQRMVAEFVVVDSDFNCIEDIYE